MDVFAQTHLLSDYTSPHYKLFHFSQARLHKLLSVLQSSGLIQDIKPYHLMSNLIGEAIYPLLLNTTVISVQEVIKSVN